MQRWSPALSFFRQRRIDVTDCERIKPFSVSWDLTQRKMTAIQRSAGRFVSCRMAAPAGETFGGGDGFLLRTATTRAFAEAWERMWLKIAHSQDLGLGVSPSSSNGFAAGATDQSAMTAARGELIERATMLTAWQSMSGWSETGLKSIWLRTFIHHLFVEGWSIKWFALTTTTGDQTLAVLGTHQKLGAVFDCVYAGRDAIVAGSVWKSLVNSLLRMTEKARSTLDDEAWQLPADGKPVDHRTFYRDPRRLEAFQFLERSTPGQKIKVEGIEGVQERILHRAGRMPAVAYAMQPDLPVLSWGTNSIAGRNPWPHPLA